MVAVGHSRAPPKWSEGRRAWGVGIYTENRVYPSESVVVYFRALYSLQKVQKTSGLLHELPSTLPST